jgi:RNA polymerase sigma-70 factor (family 1)
MQQELLHRLKNGDELAYKTIFNENYHVLVAFSNKYLKDIDIAKDIVQNVFIKFYEKRYTIEITSSLKSYLFKMVYNDCLNYIKHISITSNHYTEYSKELGTSTDFMDLVEETENEYRIFKAIEKLPPGCKQVLLRSRIDGKKNKEIADELNISIRTVETQISKALKLLKTGLSIIF